MFGAASLGKVGERKRPRRIPDTYGRRHQTAGLSTKRAKIPARSGWSEGQAESRRVPRGVADAGENDHQHGKHSWVQQQAQARKRGNEATMGDKSVETLSNKIEFLSILVTFFPFPPKQCWFFYFFDCTDHSAYTTLNWGAGGIRELTLEANKIKQMVKYRKASFPKSVSTTFVAHCSHIIKFIIVHYLCSVYLCWSVGGVVALWLVGYTLEHVIQVQALTLNSHRQPLSTQVYKWVPPNLKLGGNPAMD